MITLQNITLRRGPKLILQDTSLTLNPGEKIGLVGRNGAGKSSLFSLLTGRLQSDHGDCYIPARWLVAEVAQHLPETSQGATEFVLEGDSRLMHAQTFLAQAEALDDGQAIAEGHQAIFEAGGFNARSRAQSLLMGLGFRNHQLDAPVKSFSGGWRMRLQLARALMCPADLMLLDEPTNHLDLDALVWLEAWLKKFEGTLLIISHDREFLDAMTRVTVHLDEAKLTRYAGNYTAFEEMRAERMRLAQANLAKQQERMTHLQKFIDRFKAKASKAKQAQSRVKALARMEKLAPILTSSDFQFEFKPPLNLPNPILSLSHLSCGYGNTPTLRDIHRSLLAGQRIGVLGANGQGKSTLVKTIAHAIPPLSGEIIEGKGLSIGYFAQQELDVLQLDDGPLMHMIRLARDIGPTAREQELRDFLGSFGFIGDMVTQAVGSLSGGEKARLVLAMLVWQRPNLLLLDEPTNHLDLNTREALSMALNEFEGSVLLVSHDRALLREVCDEFWLVTQGSIQPFEGDLDDYQAWLLQSSRNMASPSLNEPSEAGRTNGLEARNLAPAGGSSRDQRQASAQIRQRQAQQSKPLKAESQKLEQQIEQWTQEKSDIEQKLATPGLSGTQIADLGKRLKLISECLDTTENRWIEINMALEALQSPPMAPTD